MRRGLIAWSKAELPEHVFDARAARVREALRGAGLDGVLVYTNFTRPAGVSWLCGFIPYWSESLLLVPREGPTTLVAALSPRGKSWIESTAYVGRIAFSGNLGAEMARQVGEVLGAKAKLGVAELDGFPARSASELREAGIELVDATALLAPLRVPADAAEVALAAKAGAIAQAALATVAADADDATAAIADVEREARVLGAEEVYVAVAPDLRADRRLFRLEGRASLAGAFALRATVAYKGVWIRLTRSFGSGLEPAIATALERFADACSRLPDLTALRALETFLIEGCSVTQPLDARVGTLLADGTAPASGALVSVQTSQTVAGVPVLLGAPVIVGSAERSGALLVAPA